MAEVAAPRRNAEPSVSASRPQAANAPDLSYASPDPVLRALVRGETLDWNTIGGLIAVHVIIAIALIVGGALSAFIDIPALLIVLLGTACVTLICVHREDVKMAMPALRQVFLHTAYTPQSLARTLVDMSIIVRKRGSLALSDYEHLWKKDPLLYPYVAMVVDGFSPQEIERMAAQELETSLELHRRAATILRRAAEAAPGMGLIGTLVGLVQMLGQLQSPETLGPSMALALLTTFYGALVGTVIMTPLANKVERNANMEALERQMILTAAIGMSTLDNPRRIEMALNAFLPREYRLSYLTRSMA